MPYMLSFLPTPNGPVGIVHVEPSQLAEHAAADRLRGTISRLLGDMPIVLRCKLGEVVVPDGPLPLRRHALAPEVDLLPVITIECRPPLRAAA